MFFPALLKTTEFTFLPEKLLKLKIEALFRLRIVYTETKKNIHTHHSKINRFIYIHRFVKNLKCHNGNNIIK